MPLRTPLAPALTLLLALPLACTTPVDDNGKGDASVPEDGGTLPQDDAGAPGPDGGDGGAPGPNGGDGGAPGSDGGDAGGDAGEDAGAGDGGGGEDDDAGGGEDGGDGGGGGGPVEDEAGDLDHPLPVTLPYEGEVAIAPVGDRDCFAFSVESAGELLAWTSNTSSPTCFGADTELFLYAGASPTSGDLIGSDDDGGDGVCSRIEEPVAPGDYVLCVAHFADSASFHGTLVSISLSAYACGDEEVDPNEECDGVQGCTGACTLDDGLPRENEAGGNDVPLAAGVLDLELDAVARGAVFPGSDVDWWRLQLPGGFSPGAVVIRYGGLDLTSSRCDGADDVRVDIFAAGEFEEPISTSVSESPCGSTTLARIHGDAVFGNELLFVRVHATGDGGFYHLVPTFIEGECGNGNVEPSEECEPGVGNTGAVCDAATCRLVPPDNNICEAAEFFALPADGTVLGIEGTTATASDTRTGSCAGATASDVGRDVYYAFTAPADGDVKIDVVADWDVAVYALQGGCDEPDEVACDVIGFSPAAEITLQVSAGTTYTVVVDAAEDKSGPYQLRAYYLVPPPNDTCDAAIDISANLVLDGPPLTLLGTTASAGNGFDWTGTGCQSSSSSNHKDVHYVLRPAASGRVTAVLDATYDAVLYALEGGCSGDGLVCADLSPETVVFDVQTGREYVLVVDAWGSGSGSFALEVELRTPPLGDHCENAIPLSAGSGSLEGTLDGALDHYDAKALGDCTGFSSTGPDVVYAIELLPGQTLWARYDAALSDTDEVLYLLDSCPPASDACVKGQDIIGGPEEIQYTHTGSGAQVYYLVIDEYASSFLPATGGPFTLEWEITGP